MHWRNRTSPSNMIGKENTASLQIAKPPILIGPKLHPAISVNIFMLEKSHRDTGKCIDCVVHNMDDCFTMSIV